MVEVIIVFNMSRVQLYFLGRSNLIKSARREASQLKFKFQRFFLLSFSISKLRQTSGGGS
jgi:hypothetical protein